MDPRRLRIAGAIALGAVSLSVLLYLVPRSPLPVREAPAGEPRYVGSEGCRSCHEKAFEAWKGSNHALAMQPATDATVLGDFGGATLEHRGRTWRFFRQGERFMAHAEGPDGAMRDFEVTYTFGVAPLQQYLVPFPGGRLQALSAAWDTRARRWFHVNPGPAAPPGDWLHWTGPGQRWNAMCSDCHSTGVRKGYDPGTDEYETTWSEIRVGCEACHGPGSRHEAWAGAPAAGRSPIENAGLVARTVRVGPDRTTALCAPCHARRAQFADRGAPGGELLDAYLPALLVPGAFHPDGQILDEDFEWQSFTQSKMHANGVGCADCHDVHSGRRRAEGNRLCTRCHQADAYDTAAHHFHRKGEEGGPAAGSLCVSCHMPGKDFMVVHFRRDHSMRIPRPDLTATLGVPNACGASGCHSDRKLSWIRARYDAWWGGERPPHPGTVIAAGRKQEPGAEAGLARLAADPRQPVVVRATAVDLLGGYPGESSRAAVAAALSDPEPIVRATAAARLAEADPAALARALGPLLEDPVRAVRAEAAARLAGPASRQLPEARRRAWEAALAEYEAGQRYMSDLPSGPFNLGNLYAALGRTADAERQYRRALALDGQLSQARVNLAMLLAVDGRGEEAEGLLRQAHAEQPGNAGIAFDLGLLLAERGDPSGAERMLRIALRADPRMAPAAFNLAVLVGERKPSEAVGLARRAVELRPGEARYAWTLAYCQSRAGDLGGAAATLEALLAAHPGQADAYRLLADVYERQGRDADAARLRRRAGNADR